MRRLLKRLIGRIYWRRMPWYVPVGGLLLCGVGAAFIRSAHSAPLAARHLAFAAIGCGAFVGLSLFDYRRLTGITLPLYGLGIAALGGLFVFGVTINNARRWYDLGLFNAQPSELMKYVLVLVLADHFGYRRHTNRLRDLAVPLGLTILPTLMIMAQPDFGTALLFLPVFFAVAFLGGVPIRNLVLVAAAGCVLLVGAWFTPGVLKPYQKSRVISFINPGSNPDSSAAYNARQAILAISAGGMEGQGWGRGVLNRLGRVPERHTDFIFPVIAEEWGFARTAPLVGFYLLMVFALARLAWLTREPFGRLIIGGVAALFAVQSLLHMAISLRLAPITGLTLPLISYGGSSLVSTFAGFGLVAGVRMRRSIIFKRDEEARAGRFERRRAGP